jgi:hypothetical protein
VISTVYSFDYDFIPPEQPDPAQEGSFRAAGPATRPRLTLVDAPLVPFSTPCGILLQALPRHQHRLIRLHPPGGSRPSRGGVVPRGGASQLTLDHSSPFHLRCPRGFCFQAVYRHLQHVLLL